MIFSEYNFFKVNFIEPASPLMYGIIELHDHIFFFLNMILFLVLFLLFTTIRYFSYKTNSTLNKYLLSQSVKTNHLWAQLSSGVTIEIIWTVIPSLILILIAIPSFALLYATDELVDPSLTIQVIGHQWYWSYEYNDLIIVDETNASTPEEGLSIDYSSITLQEVNKLVLKADSFNNLGSLTKYSKQIDLFNLVSPFSQSPLQLSSAENLSVALEANTYVSGTVEFDSYMRQESDLNIGEFRLYETDFPLVLPKFTHIRSMITADDVIHSWSVPALGIKVDAVPGRLNHAHTYIKYSGIFYGQCSELCGVNHAFTPIQILVFEPQLYYDYIRLLLLKK